jgi:hypothetical protein
LAGFISGIGAQRTILNLAMTPVDRHFFAAIINGLTRMCGLLAGWLTIYYGSHIT